MYLNSVALLEYAFLSIIITVLSHVQIVSCARPAMDDWLPDEELSVDSTDVEHINYDSLLFMGLIRISVKDSGVGMTEDNLSNLFQEGVQFNANQLQGGKGSGLGLWVSKGFAQRHNGDIHAESAGSGHGSTFTLELPVYERRTQNNNDAAYLAARKSCFSEPVDGQSVGGSSLSYSDGVDDSKDSFDVEIGSLTDSIVSEAGVNVTKNGPENSDSDSVEEYITLRKGAKKNASQADTDIMPSEIFHVCFH